MLSVGWVLANDTTRVDALLSLSEEDLSGIAEHTYVVDEIWPQLGN